MLKLKSKHIEGIQLFGYDRLAKIIPVAAGREYSVGSGIYQCTIRRPIRCKVAVFAALGEAYQGDYR